MGILAVIWLGEHLSLCVFEVEHKGEDWESLEKVRLPLCLNLSQCKLELGEYREVVELNTKLLKKHKGERIQLFTALMDRHLHSSMQVI